MSEYTVGVRNDKPVILKDNKQIPLAAAVVSLNEIDTLEAKLVEQRGSFLKLTKRFSQLKERCGDLGE